MHKSLITLFSAALFSTSALSAQFEMRLPFGGANTPNYTYDINYGGFGACDLGTSTQSRTAECVRDQGALVVLDSFCDPMVTSQSCSPAYTYSLDYSAWGSCDLGASIQSRTYQCLRDYDSLAVGDLNCGVPLVSQSCTPAYTYSFNYGTWGACDPGTSTQSRTSQCLRNYDSVVVDNLNCGTAVSSQSCTPTYTYTGSYSAYSACSGNPITKTKTASCTRDYDSTLVANSFCGISNVTTDCSYVVTGASPAHYVYGFLASDPHPFWVLGDPSHPKITIPGTSVQGVYDSSVSAYVQYISYDEYGFNNRLARYYVIHHYVALQ
mgnify:CR=1 FL=1